jgi:hypothetical protein
MSANMASFLQDLQRQEYEKAISRETIGQNAARLGISEADLQRRAGTDAARLGLARERNEISWANLALRAENAANRASEGETNEQKKKQKAVKAAQARLLKDKKGWLRADKVGTGVFRWNIQFTSPFGIQTIYDAEGATAQAAIDRQISEGRIQAAQSPRAYNPREIMTAGKADIKEVTRAWVSALVAAGMNRRRAIRWVNSELGSPQTGVFLGGAGGG